MLHKVAKCPVCGSENAPLLERSESFLILQCRRCQLQFAQGIREEYIDVYTTDPIYAITTFRASEMSLKEMRERGYHVLPEAQKQALLWLRRHLNAGSTIIDIGHGAGWFLAACEQAGFNVVGLEASKDAVTMLLKKGFRVVLSSVENYPDNWPEPDAVTLFEVIEHVSEPVELLREILYRFPRAPLLLSTPSPRRWNLYFKYREPFDYPPNHLTRWSVRSIKVALKKAGYLSVYVQFVRVTGEDIYARIRQFLLQRFKLEATPLTLSLVEKQRITNIVSRIKRSRIKQWMYDIYDISNKLSKLFFKPLSLIFNTLGLSGLSMLVIALPPTYEKSTMICRETKVAKNFHRRE